jgi:hypothetical protein
MTDSSFDEGAWREQIEDGRAEKDEFFADDPRSPLSPEQRDAFDGLEYFPPDPSYRVSATATVHDDPEVVELTVENGNPTRFHEVVTFEFELPQDGESTQDDGNGTRGDDEDQHSGDATVTETLSAYQPEGGDGSLFVPFRDKTTGQETYKGGRYMDLHPDGELTDGATVTVDFNLAYTPFCAFADAFACPLPPEENWLSTTVLAGEKDPSLST